MDTLFMHALLCQLLSLQVSEVIDTDTGNCYRSVDILSSGVITRGVKCGLWLDRDIVILKADRSRFATQIATMGFIVLTFGDEKVQAHLSFQKWKVNLKERWT
jgi:hypothetical protein